MSIKNWWGGVVLLLISGSALASTLAGVNIINNVTVDYKVNTVDQTQINSGNCTGGICTDTFKVDTKIDLTVGTNPATTVFSGSTNRVLTFTVTNTGNSTKGVALSLVSGTDATDDQFNMNNVRIYIDNTGAGSVGSFDVANDILYTGATFADNLINAGDLVKDGGAITVFVVADSPTGRFAGDTSKYALVARTLNSGAAVNAAGTLTTATGSNGKLLNDTMFADGAGSGGVTGVTDVALDGRYSNTGTYTVEAVGLVVTKTSVVTDDGIAGSPEYAIPGATITYSIRLENSSGTTAATDIVIADGIPAGTTYVANSVDIDMNGNGVINAGVDDTNVTDGSNGANSGVGVAFASPNLTVGKVGTGALTIAAGGVVIITFDVTIN